MIGIIGAMLEEVNAFKEIMKDKKEEKIEGITFIKGTINNKEVVLCLSGVGKVNASVTTTLMIVNFHPEYIINVGTAGGLLKKQNTLDIVVSDKVIQHDYDTTYLDGKDGLGIAIQSDKELAKKVVSSYEVNNKDFNIYNGDIISGDTFVGTQEKIVELINKFPSAIACEMESGAISQTCHKLKVPFIIIRALSDIVYHDNSNIDFKKNLKLSSKRSAEMVKILLDDK